jgi:tetratricopeptide (TPR) repeat protein
MDYSCAYHPKPTGAIRRCLAALACALLLVLPLRSQEPAEAATLYGTVRDAQGMPLATATVRLRASNTTQFVIAHTDPEGRYSFPGIHEGVYYLRAEMTGYSDAEISSIFLGPKEAKTLDLTLVPAKSPMSQAASPPEFFDQPQFTVSGVTDTTNLGGHGSDTVVRTREALAKETASLGKDSSNTRPATLAASESSLREKVEREPNGFEPNRQLGKALVESGKAREAIPYLERAAKLNPNDYGNAYELAHANADAESDDRAREQVQALLVHHDTAELHHLLADIRERLGNSLEAVREFQRAAELDPNEPYLFDWGSELLLHRAPEPALEVFTKANRLFPHSARLLIGLGAAWFARGSYELAVRRISEASDLNPNDSVPYLFLGKMQGAESAPSDELVERLHRFVTLHPESAEANYYYAVSLWKQRKKTQTAGASQVESLLNIAIGLDPRFSAAYLQRGILHSEQENTEQAISDYQSAIQADPQMADPQVADPRIVEEAHYRLAQAYRQAGETNKAKSELQVYAQIVEQSAQKAERERHEIRQFVYTLRDQPPAQKP